MLLNLKLNAFSFMLKKESGRCLIPNKKNMTLLLHVPLSKRLLFVKIADNWYNIISKLDWFNHH